MFAQTYIQGVFEKSFTDKNSDPQAYYFFKDARPYKYSDIRGITYRNMGSTLSVVWIPTAQTCLVMYGDQLPADKQGQPGFGLPGTFTADMPQGDLLRQLKQLFPTNGALSK